MASTSTARRGLATVESFLDEVKEKVGAAHTEPGSQGGETTHPVKSVDDNTRDATTGARSAENAKDIKKDQGKPSVDSTPEATAKKADGGGTASEDQLQIGTKKGPTGTDVPATKPGKEDPGTTHPAKTDNDALNGGKYAGDVNTMPREKLASMVGDLGNEILADIVTMVTPSKAAAAAPASPAPAAPKTAAAVDPAAAQQAGWDMASLAAGKIDKQAADAMVINTITQIIKEAEADADRVVTYLRDYYTEQQTKAADGMGGGGGGDPAAMAAAMGGGGGGDPAASGGKPEGGGDPTGGGGDPAAGGGGGQDIIMQLCQQLGITPEELEQALAAEQGGGGQAGGGMPPPGAGGGGGAMPTSAAGGGMPPGGGAPPQGGMEVAASAKTEVQKEAVAYVMEVVGRYRQKLAAQKAQAK